MLDLRFWNQKKVWYSIFVIFYSNFLYVIWDRKMAMLQAVLIWSGQEKDVSNRNYLVKNKDYSIFVFASVYSLHSNSHRLTSFANFSWMRSEMFLSF